MAAANLRSALARMARSENEAVLGRKFDGPGPGGIRGARPMQDIGNTVGISTKGTKGGKTEAVKPPRGLSKQRTAPSELPVRVMAKRKSAEKGPEPMDISGQEDKFEDVEMEPTEADPGPALRPDAFPVHRLALVEDIDKGDEDDPQLVTEYVHHIYIYLRKLEKDQCVEEDYLGNKKGGAILPKMRAVLIDWLVEVHQQFSMLQETLYLTVAILDRYLQKAAPTIPRKSLQLVGVTAMFVASKYEEMYAPEIGDFVYITDSAYTQAEIRRQEIEILKVLNFDLGRPLPLHFLRRNSKAGFVDARVHTLAKYIMELTIVEYSLMHIPPSKLAAASLAISTKFFDEGDKALPEYWTPTLAYYTMYEWSDLSKLVDELLNVVVKTCEARPDAKLMAIRQKYSNKKFGKIAIVAQSKVASIRQMRCPEFATSSPK